MLSDKPKSLRERLALAQHARRHALYEAREAHGERPSTVPELPEPSALPRDELPTFDDLTSADPARAKPARWKLVLALAAALGGLGELARQVSGLLSAHGK